jgi:hypothetical protein
LSAAERSHGGGEIIEGRVAQMALIKIFRPRRMSDRGEPLADEIGFRRSETADHAFGGHSKRPQ